jgi:pSer/pThr/pTyr-binding forkhead associated (FHA) protein
VVNQNETNEQTPKDDSPIVPFKNRGEEAAELITSHYVGNAVSHENGRLVIDFGNLEQTIVVSTGQSVILGRSDENNPNEVNIDLRPFGASDKSVSRRHARLHRTSSIIYITDLNSRNGTFLNGERLSPHQSRILRDEDEVQLGRLVFRVHLK